MQEPIHFHRGEDGIVTLTFDAPDAPVNTMSDAMRQSLSDATERLEAERAGIAGVILASAKDTFFAGGDLRRLYDMQPQDAQKLLASIEMGHRSLRRLEKLGKPVVALLHGTALGGGFEIALACNRRIALRAPKVQFGFPEASLGLMPGLGGVARLTRMLGLAASQPYLQDSQLLAPEDALCAGFVDELAATREEMMEKARAWIFANPATAQPWDRADFAVPGGLPNEGEAKRWLAAGAAAQVRAKTRGRFPAPEAILSASVEGLQVDFDAACKVESRYFVGIATGGVAKNIIGTFWFQANEIKAGAQRPAGIAKKDVKRLAVLGSGMMGKGIAYVAASRGIDVVVKDVSLAQAESSIADARKLLAKRVEKGEIDSARMESVLARIRATGSYADLSQVDAVIEAVPENGELKAAITRDAEPNLPSHAFWASNTSTLPITGLASASEKPERFVGMHFFSPVHRMQLVEVIKGRRTSAETLAQALDLAMLLGKTPIVVNDSRGFFTSRVFSTFTREGVSMVGEGQDPAAIEAAAMFAGFPVGPLAVLDEVSLSLSFNNRLETLKAFAAEGRPLPAHPADEVMARMLDEFGRKGRAAGGGFYDYPKDGPKQFWGGLKQNFRASGAEISQQDKQDRLLFCMALESVRILQEGVLDQARDGNIGSVLGIGFPRWTGGVFQYLNWMGLDRAVERAGELRSRYGERFAPPELLLQRARDAAPF